MESIVDAVNGIIWSKALIALCLGAGLYFTLRTRFMQIRHLADMLRLTVSGKSSEAGVSSFQALAMSMAGRIGIGNIAGVATAIYFGGPGAIFWMWVMGFLGTTTSYIESTLAQIYKEKDDKGQYRGGPAYYIEKGLGLKWYAWLFALATVLACGFLMPGVQANAIADSMLNVFGAGLDESGRTTLKIGVGIGVAALLGVIIFGGLKRIAGFAEIVVPFMAIGYILTAVLVMVVNYEFVPEMFVLIFSSAFGTEATFGAMLGLAVEWGVKRGIYANEAGQGTGPHAAAAAEVKHPAEQGFVQAFSIYFDTMFVCTSTAFIILSSGMYNVAGVDGALLHERLPGVDSGAGYVQAGINTVLPGIGGPFVAVALFFFAFTTIMAYYYMAETNLTYINRKVHRPWLLQAIRLGILGMVIYGCVSGSAVAWGLGDIGVGLMAWLNIIAILILQKPALKALRDYEAQKRLGKRQPEFDPEANGIANADFWKRKA